MAERSSGVLMCHVIWSYDEEVVSLSLACVGFYFFQNIAFLCPYQVYGTVMDSQSLPILGP